MESEQSVINDGRILVVDGMIEAVWSATDTPPATAQGVVQYQLVALFIQGLLTHIIMPSTTLFHFGIMALMAGTTATNGKQRTPTEMQRMWVAHSPILQQ